MPVPVYLATFAACGSLITSVKSSWELSRMVRKKAEEHHFNDDAGSVYRKLRRAYENGYMSPDDYDKWYENWLVAKGDKDYAGLRRVRAHLRIVHNNAYSREHDEKRSHGSSSSATSSSSRQRRHQSVSFDSTRRTTLSYRADPPPRYRDIEWPTRAGSIEYYRDGDDRHAGGAQLARLQRRSSVSYPRDRGRGSERGSNEERGSRRGGSGRSASTSRYDERRDGRGRGRRRWDEEGDDYYGDEETESEFEEEKGYDKRAGRERRQ